MTGGIRCRNAYGSGHGKARLWIHWDYPRNIRMSWNQEKDSPGQGEDGEQSQNEQDKGPISFYCGFGVHLKPCLADGHYVMRSGVVARFAQSAHRI